MRALHEGEKLTLTQLLQMETNALAKAQAIKGVITDEELQKEVESGILAMKGRIKGIQQFINENNVIGEKEVH